jgi:hypothetical protein
MKLLAACDALSTETQVKLLHTPATDRSDKLHPSIVLKALESPNEYVRYAAVRAIPLDEQKEEDRKILEKIASDRSPRVKYAQEERQRNTWHIRIEIEQFEAI